jgi:hypothetical protein
VRSAAATVCTDSVVVYTQGLESGGSWFETCSGVIPQAVLLKCGHNSLVPQVLHIKRMFIAMQPDLRRWLLCLARLRTACSRLGVISSFTFFLRKCLSETSLHFYAVNSLSRQIARTNQIAHQISLVLPVKPAAPDSSTCPPYSTAAGMMMPLHSRADSRKVCVVTMKNENTLPPLR